MSVNGVTNSVSSDYSGYTNYNRKQEAKAVEKTVAE